MAKLPWPFFFFHEFPKGVRMMAERKLGWKAAAVLAAAVLVLLALKAPPALDASLRIRTLVLNAFMFALAAPSIWFVVRMAFGTFAGVFATTLFSLLVLLPMWVFFGQKSQTITFGADPTVYSLFSSRWVLLACAAAAYWLARRIAPKKAPWGGRREKLRAAAILVLVMLTIPQVVLRFGTYSPTGIQAMDQNDSAIRPGSDGYFKLAYPTNDIQQHINLGGLFTGRDYDESLSKGYSVSNDRPTIGYLYSAIGYFAHPYVGGRVLLYCFYVLTVVCVFRLARAGGMSHGLSLAFDTP